MTLPSTLPVGHRVFLENAIQTLKRDGRIVGVAAGGSFATDTMDEHSDLDLILAIDPKHTLEVMRDRPMIAGRLGALLAAFTGEHVGEPRLLICLYGPPLLHVDLKFVDLNELAPRIESPVVLWERNAEMSFALAQTAPTPLSVDDDWIEDRFWVWIHYGATKVARGELFEALSFLADLRSSVLGPMALRAAGTEPRSMRRLETAAPERIADFRETLGTYDSASCVHALRQCVRLYRSLRSTTRRASPVEQAVIAHLDALDK